jgi:hypothetical protein
MTTEVDSKRGLLERLRILRLFVTTTTYDKPSALPHRYWSLRWWREAWKDTARLGQ